MLTNTLELNTIYKVFINAINQNSSSNSVRNNYSIVLTKIENNNTIASRTVSDTSSTPNNVHNNIYLGTGEDKTTFINGEIGYILYSSDNISAFDYLVRIYSQPNNTYNLKQKIPSQVIQISNSDTNKLSKINQYYSLLNESTATYDLPNETMIVFPITNSTYDTRNENYTINVYTIKNNGNVNTQNLTEISNHKYIYITKINQIKDNYNDVSVILFGDKNLSYIYPFSRSSNIIVLVMYKVDNSYNFELVPVDINLFYNYNYEFALKRNQNMNYTKQEFWPYMEGQNVGYIPRYEYTLTKDDSNLNLNISIGFTKRENSITQTEKFILQNLEIDNQEIQTCNFEPSGETIDQCKLLCNNERSTNFCSPSDCNLRCDTCSNSLCKWNVSEIRKQNTLRPDTCSIKGFSGKNTIKLTWVKPDSSFDILKYYIIVTNSDVNEPDFLQIHNIEDNRDLLDYYIINLKNDIIYNVFVISKNKYGVSDKSNIVSIIPKENGDDFSIKKKNSFSNSLQNYYNMSETQYQKQLTLFEKQVVYNDIKDILIEDLKFKVPQGNYNLNII